MSDIADNIREAVNRTRPSGTPQDTLNQQDEFMKLRAHVVGTLLYAHRQLSGDEYTVIDDRILAAVVNWLESKRAK